MCLLFLTPQSRTEQAELWFIFTHLFQDEEAGRDGAKVELRAALVGGALAVASVAPRLWLPLFRVLSSVGVNTNSSSFSVAGANAGASPRLFQDNLRSGLQRWGGWGESKRRLIPPIPPPPLLPRVFCVLAPFYAWGALKDASLSPTHLAAARAADHLTCARPAVGVNHRCSSRSDPEALG